MVCAKFPDNVPNPETLTPYLQMPLTAVPDPFGTHDSFGAHNNARLQNFLDSFGFEYEFISATKMYKSGAFDPALLHILAALSGGNRCYFANPGRGAASNL